MGVRQISLLINKSIGTLQELSKEATFDKFR